MLKWGEWLEPNDPLQGMLNTEWTAETRHLLSVPHIPTAYFAYSTRLLAEAAQVLGKEDDVQEYSTLHQRIKEAYIYEHDQSEEGRWAAYSLAVCGGFRAPFFLRLAGAFIVDAGISS